MTIRRFTPGRVNLIGEHTDYNGGMVLPTAIKLGTTIDLTPRHDDIIRIQSDKFEGITGRTLSDDAIDHWSDYVLGAIKFANEVELIE